MDGVGRDFVSGLSCQFFSALTTQESVCVHITGGVLVPSRHGTGSNEGYGGMEQETDRKSMSKEEQHDHNELCSVVECTDRMSHCRRAIFPYVDFVAGKGMSCEDIEC